MLIAFAAGVDMSVEALAVLVVLNIIATISLWRRAARRPPRPKKKFLRTLMHSEPITPKHEPPNVAGGQFKSQADDVDRRFFSDFAEFADVANWWLADETVGTHWRLQELPDGDLSLNVNSSYGPTLGRCYDIFHNQVRLGRLEIRPGDEYSAAAPRVITEVELQYVRLLSFDNIAGFLGTIAMHVCDDNPKSDEYFNAYQAIVGALTKALWQTQQITEFDDLDGQDWGELQLQLRGVASPWYIRRREALQKARARQPRI